MTWTPYLALHALSLLVELGILAFVLRRRGVQGVSPFALAVAGQAWWTLGYVFEVLSPSLGQKIFWDDVQTLGSAAWCIGLTSFAASYTQREFLRSRAVKALHALVFGGFVVLSFSDPLHHLVRPDARLVSHGDLTALVYSFTTLALISAAYLLLCFAVSIGVLTRHAFKVARPLRMQGLLVAAGTAIPVLGIVLTLAGALPEALRDATPLTFAGGDLLLAWGLFRHRILELAPIARDLVFENLRDMVVVVDARGLVLDVNPAMLRALGREPSEVVGQPTREVFARWADLVERFEAIDEGQVEFDVPQDGGRSISLTIAAIRNRRGERLGRVMVARDVTELKRAELELQQTNTDLRASNNELDAFSYSISHDLRAPLRTMSVFSKRLLEVHAGELSSDARELVERVQSNAVRMQSLIDALLGFARLGRAPLRKGEVDMAALARQVAEEHIAEVDPARLELRVGELPPAHGDAALLRQVFGSLLANAVKFSRNAPRAVIEVCSRSEGDRLVYFVRDNGAGFDMEYQDKLFGVFQRLHDQSEFEGNGIGLVSAKQIIQRHGGKIWAEGTPGAGATFYFTLS